jgi:hypothetical protein
MGCFQGGSGSADADSKVVGRRGRGPCPRSGFLGSNEKSLGGGEKGKANDALSAKINNKPEPCHRSDF